VPGTCEIEGTRHLSLLALHVASNGRGSSCPTSMKASLRVVG
jgi:hypothetical protein